MFYWFILIATLLYLGLLMAPKLKSTCTISYTWIMGWLFKGKCTSKARLDGKTVVITGCNTGIGIYTVLDLYARGAHVIMACRDTTKAEAARDWVIDKCKDKDGLGKMSIYKLDLASLTSVRECAQKIHDEESHIHILINNAGIMMCPRALTEDGYELQFATNHLGHFLFTLILLPRILNSVPARIVNVSSVVHVLSRSIDFDDINMEKSYDSKQAYGRSKLCNIIFAKELAKRLKDTGVTVYSLHPGVVDTNLSQHFDKTVFPGAKWIFQNVGGFFMKSPEQGAQTTLYCAIDEKTANETGLYYDDCKKVIPTALALDEDLAKKLWYVSLDMVKLTPPPPFGKSS